MSISIYRIEIKLVLLYSLWDPINKLIGIFTDSYGKFLKPKITAGNKIGMFFELIVKPTKSLKDPIRNQFKPYRGIKWYP